ncbi:MAG TPA: prolyl oligopeptidase family serine peptidase [Pyrinomonadaceae bacterium]|nr:prolyl oligopeptidase family serine peptidase [Pyrinomonadaceae bacterium]
MKKLLLLCVILSLATFNSLAANGDKFSLEQVMSAPFPTGLVASPVGGKVAWMQSAKGVRNVWVAEPPSYKGRQLTAFTEDDGIEIGELTWTPDASAVIYTRGGDLDSFAENTNPRSNPEEPKQGLWIAALSGGAPRQLAEGHSAVISKTGDRVFFVKGREVWQAKLDANEKPSVLIQPKGRVSFMVLSPDGSMLAFTNTRGDHGFVGVYDFAAKQLRYLDPSVDRDSEPAWSTDSKQLAFIRVPASREAFIFGPKRSAADPWSIRIADAKTGVGNQVWKADAGQGSVLRETVADNLLYWSADNHIVFPWEKDGWTHLYSVLASGEKQSATLLTPGEFEVEHVSLAPGAKEIVYSSNQGDIDHRHVWRVATAGGQPPRAITTGNGIEYSPIVLSDQNTVAFLRADAKRPERASIVQGSNQPQDLAADSIPNEFPETDLVEPQQVIFNSADGMKIHGQLFMPPNIDRSKKYPALLFFHGGSRRQMLLGWHYNYYYRNSYAMNEYLANHGYIVMSVNYRSGIGYGMLFREALNYGATGGSEFQDVLGAGLYMRSRPEVDTARIGLWGGSYGGYLTAMGLSRASDLFAAGVDMHGVHDWNIVIRNFVPAYDPAAKPDAARLAFESSPLASIKTWHSPVLLIHGDDDRNVPFSETVHLVEALRSQGVEFEQLIFPDEIHDFLTHSDWLRAYHASVEFFDKHLMK